MDPEIEGLDAEVRELLTNYRNARCSTREPCHTENIVESLAGFQEELGLLNLKYVFNPYTDLCDTSHALRPHAVVALVNAAYALLHRHKRTVDSETALTASNHALEQNNAFLNTKIERLTSELARTEHYARSCISEGVRASEQASAARAELRAARAQVAQLTARAAANEHASRVKTTRAERDNRLLQDKFRDKCGTFLSTSESRSGALGAALERESAHKEVIRKLDRHNRDLLDEVLALKHDLLTQSLDDTHIHK